MRPRLPGRVVTGVFLCLLLLAGAIPAAAAEAPEFEESFDGDGWQSNWAGWSPGPLNRAALSPAFEDHGLTVSIPARAHYGTRFAYPFARMTGSEPDSLYFRYYLRFAEDFGREGTGKLPGPVGIYHGTGLGGSRSTPGRPGWSARMQFSPGPVDGTTRLGYYTYHLDQSRGFGDGFGWSHDTGVLTNGEWYCVEGHVDLNTPGQADGILRGWVDGQPAFERTDLSFRREGEERINISSFWFNVYFGGKATPSAEKNISFDQVAIGPERIGCGDATTVAVADVTGDGRDDAVELVECADSLCWAVEEGGPVSFTDVNAIATDARPAALTEAKGVTAGFFDDDPYADLAYLGRCPDGSTCWIVHRGTGEAPGPAEPWGKPGEVTGTNVDVGLLTGDVDGDGRDDLVTRGRCDDAECWLIHRSTGDGFAPAISGGDGAYFSDGTEAFGVELADVTGDGLDDLVYRGFCGDQQPCWRVQPSTGGGFGAGQPWGNTTGFAGVVRSVGFVTGDLNGDGREDIVYRGDCNGEECWRALLSSDAVFEARYWGSEGELTPRSDEFASADVDGNGVSDIIYRSSCDGEECWKVHVSTGTGFVSVESQPVVVDEIEILPAVLNPDLQGPEVT